MMRNETTRISPSAAQLLVGLTALALLTWVCFRLGLNVTTTALAYLILIVLLSLMGSFVSVVVSSVAAVACLNYFFVEPIFAFRFDYSEDVAELVAFLVAALVVTALVGRARGLAAAALHSQKEVQAQAQLLDLTHDTVFVRDMNDIITYWNRGAAELYGWSSAQAVGQVTHELLHTRFPKPLAEITEELLRTTRWEGELVHTKRDGTQVVVASRWALQRDERGTPTAILETNNDVTERKRADSDRERAEYVTGQVFETSPDQISIITTDYRFERVNPGYERRWGIPTERIVGMQVGDLVGNDVFEQAVKSLLDRCFAGEEVSFAGWVTSSLGRRYVAVTYSPLRPYSGRVEAALVISRDLTEHMLAAEALREAQAELAHVTRVTTLGEVTASFAHELNQPLAAIVNNANACLGLLPQRRHDLDEVRDALDDIVADAERASAIIDRVRGLARRSSPEKVPLQLGDVVKDVVALARTESVARSVAIHTDIAAPLPPVLGDRVQLQQVLLNLVVNAMDAMGSVSERERRLEIRGLPDRYDDSPAVRISVQDRGVGLDPGQVKRLFEPFYTTKSQGMGMGLAISRSIIEAHGGRLWAESNRGPGATFSFSLPAQAYVALA